MSNSKKAIELISKKERNIIYKKILGRSKKVDFCTFGLCFEFWEKGLTAEQRSSFYSLGDCTKRITKILPEFGLFRPYESIKDCQGVWWHFNEENRDMQKKNRLLVLMFCIEMTK